MEKEQIKKQPDGDHLVNFVLRREVARERSCAS